MTGMFRFVLFDLDGTLLNTIDDLADSGNWVCRRHGWPVHSVEEYKRFVGDGITKLVERFTPEEICTPRQIQQVLEEYLPYYDAHKQDKTAPYPGMPELIQALLDRGIQSGVLSNKADELVGPIMEHYYPGQFLWVQGALPEKPTKPDPTLLHRLVARMGAEAGETLFVGDSEVDIQTAKNGGLTSCGVLWGFRSRQELIHAGADYLVQTPQQLFDLILSRKEACSL